MFVTGDYRQSLTLAGGLQLSGNDGFVARYLPGTHQWSWARNMGGTTSGRLVSPRADAQGHLYVAGWFSGTTTLGPTPLVGTSYAQGIVARLDAATGTGQWAVLGGDSTRLRSLDLAGNRLYVTGNFSGTTSLGGTTLTTSDQDGLVARLDVNNGTWLWAKAITGTGTAVGNDLTILSPNDLLVGGNFELGSLRFDNLTVASATDSTAGSFVARLTDIANGLPEDEANAAFSLSPNPAHATVRLSGGTGPADVVDALGRTVRTANLDPQTSHLDLSGLRPGLYLVRRGGATRRLVVE